MWLQSKAARDKGKLSIPVSCLHLSVSRSASIFGCGFIYWISGHASSVQTLPPGLAQTPSQDASSNDISGLQRWCNDNCEECSIPERSASSVIHRLAAALHKAHCWNTYFTLLVSLRQSLAPAPCLGLDGEAELELDTVIPYPRLPLPQVLGAPGVLDYKCLIKNGNAAAHSKCKKGAWTCLPSCCGPKELVASLSKAVNASSLGSFTSSVPALNWTLYWLQLMRQHPLSQGSHSRGDQMPHGVTTHPGLTLWTLSQGDSRWNSLDRCAHVWIPSLASEHGQATSCLWASNSSSPKQEKNLKTTSLLFLHHWPLRNDHYVMWWKS